MGVLSAGAEAVEIATSSQTLTAPPGPRSELGLRPVGPAGPRLQGPLPWAPRLTAKATRCCPVVRMEEPRFGKTKSWRAAFVRPGLWGEAAGVRPGGGGEWGSRCCPAGLRGVPEARCVSPQRLGPSARSLWLEPLF